MSVAPVISRDRQTARRGGLAGLVVASVAAMAATGWLLADTLSTPPVLGAAVLGLVALLSVGGLRSISVRLLTGTILCVSGLLLATIGRRSSSWTSPAAGVVWVVAVVAVLVLLAHLADPDRGRSHPNASPDAAPAGPRPTGAGLARRAAAVSGLIIAVLGLVLPAASTIQPRPRTGDEPRMADDDEAFPLMTSDSLDMTQRPRLSDRVVMRVRSDHATFWRTDTFDLWDGRTWSRSDGGFAFVEDGRVRAAPDDIAATGGDVIEQSFTIEAPAAVALPAAPSAVEVDVEGLLYQRSDGSLVLDPPLGEGGRYSVVSRRVPTSDAVLQRATGPTPPDVADRYAATPATTDRVLAAARSATAGAGTRLEQVRAIEAWMGARTLYSLDAPLAPVGVDVVDHFLFESREGWCEQIASSFVVLARAVGIPARLATGYVPGEVDRVTGEFVVRERQAHAWAEIWFPDTGWVPFDPTAEVPTAGDDSVEDWTTWLTRWWPRVLIGALVAVALAVAARFVAGTVRRRRARARRPAAGRLEARLDALGERSGRPRDPAESATAFSSTLADHLGRPDLVTVGDVVDRTLYGPDPPSPADEERADAALGSCVAG